MDVESLRSIFNEKITESDSLSVKESEIKNPFKYKYEARVILLNLRSKVAQCISANLTIDQQQQISNFLALVDVKLGLNYYETDELAYATASLTRSINEFTTIEHLEINRQHTSLPIEVESEEIHAPIVDIEDEEESEEVAPEPTAISENNKTLFDITTAISTEITSQDANLPIDLSSICEFIDAYNYLGMIWTNRNSHRTAEKYFKKAEKIYHAYMQHPERDEEKVPRLEDMYTMSAFYLAQVYGNLGLAVQSAKYCHTTLLRQLDNETQFNKVEWSTNCIHLSGFYLSENDFAQAEHCMNAAAYVLPQHVDEVADANLAMGWGKYYLHLLKFSRESAIEQLTDHLNQNDSENDLIGDLEVDSQSNESSSNQLQDDIVPKRSNVSKLPRVRFEKLPISFSEHIPIVKNFEEAREVFKKALKSFNDSMKYYQLDGFVTEHIEILKDISMLYRVLMFWETEYERKIAMQKRRADLLAPLVDELNVNVYLMTLKQLTFELGEIYSECVDIIIKHRQLDDISYLDSLKMPIDKKLLEATTKGVQYYTRFIKLFYTRNTTDGEIEPQNRTSFLQAHFCVARLCSKIPTRDPLTMVKNLKQSYDEYKFIVAFAKKHSMTAMADEVNAAQQMVALLPMKISEVNALAHR